MSVAWKSGCPECDSVAISRRGISESSRSRLAPSETKGTITARKLRPEDIDDYRCNNCGLTFNRPRERGVDTGFYYTEEFTGSRSDPDSHSRPSEKDDELGQ